MRNRSSVTVLFTASQGVGRELDRSVCTMTKVGKSAVKGPSPEPAGTGKRR